MPLLASANCVICDLAAPALVTLASDLAANATVIMANSVINVTAAEPVEYRIPGTT